MDYTVSTKSIHAIKTQLFRWYTFYEREMNKERISDQLEILSDEVTINSMGKIVTGKEEYEKILPIYKGTKNAHKFTAINVNNDAGAISAQAEIIFQTIRADNTTAQMKIAYDLQFLAFNGKELPLFQNITIKPLEQQAFDTFSDTYPTNRLSALMHCWLFNIKQMNGDAEPFKKLLAEEFELHFSKDNIVSSMEQFEKWVKYAASAVSETNHFPEDFEVKTIEENLYEMDVDFVWRGKSPKGDKLQAMTHHKWIVEDDINAPFAKIRKMEVTYKMPFSPLEG
ncbi:MAG: hypothetical protein AAGG68_09415 [Bacteroidota bacterium]